MLEKLKKFLRRLIFAPPPKRRYCPHCGGVRCFGACQYPDPREENGRSRASGNGSGPGSSWRIGGWGV